MEDPVIVVNKTYYQITHLSEDGGVATLKDWAEGSLNGDTRTIKVWWEEDGEIIKDGLSKEGKEVFCTVYEIMGKEVMVNFQLKEKDPPILKMPDLVMNMIFSTARFKDLLNCRLVCPEWGFDNLPIQRVFGCKSLTFNDSHSITVQPYKPLKLSQDIPSSISTDLNTVLAMMEASLFKNLENLNILLYFDDPQLPVPTVLKNTKSKALCYAGEHLDTESWTSLKKFISKNHQNLEELQLIAEFPEYCINIKTFLGKCPSLQKLKLMLSYTSYLEDVRFLPPSITHLSLLKLAIPLSTTQVSIIATNLTKLVQVELQVCHTCAEDQDDDEDELTGSMIADILSNHPNIQAIHFAFGDLSRSTRSSPMVYKGVCEAVREMKHYLERKLGNNGWEIHLGDVFFALHSVE